MCLLDHCLQVRARPLNTDPNLAAAAAAGPQPQQQEGAQEASACGGAQSCSGGSGGQQHKQRATTDAMCAGPERSHWGVGGGAGVGVGAPYWAQVVGSRRTTWEGVAFTAKEQARLDQVRSLLETEKLQVGGGQGGRAGQPHTRTAHDTYHIHPAAVLARQPLERVFVKRPSLLRLFFRHIINC